MSLGNRVVLIRIISCMLCGIVAGLFIYFFYQRKNKNFFDFSKFDEPLKNNDVDNNLFICYLKNVLRNIKATGPYFLFGILLSSLFQIHIKEEMLIKFFGGDKAFGVLMAATIGVPLYVCGGGTIPLLRTWLSDGMSLGAATSFMITGPVTKITNLGAIKICLGIKNFIIYIIYTILFSIASGIIVNIIFK